MSELAKEWLLTWGIIVGSLVLAPPAAHYLYLWCKYWLG